MAIILLSMVCLSSYAQTTYYVSTSGNDTNNGRSWANAYRNLQTAITSSTSGDEIWVAAGTYYPDEGTGQTDNDRTSTFNLKGGESIYGGFAGTETLLSERDWKTNVTILSGDLDQNDGNTGNLINDLVGNNAYHVVKIESGTGTVLDGFTIMGGNANGTSGSDYLGGGIYMSLAGITLNNMKIDQNYGSNGGGICAQQSSLVLTNSTVSNNTANSWGGGIYSTFAATTVELTNVTIQSNTSLGLGGGILNANGDIELTNSIIVGNNSSSDGGGFYGAIGNCLITNTLIAGNLSSGNGGGVYQGGSNTTQYKNVTISGNSAGNGGGAHLLATSTASFQNSVIWNNLSAGVKNTSEASVADNSATITYSKSLVANISGTGIISSADPLFVTDLDPATAPGTAGDFRLRAGSPAIDAGDNSLNTEAFDLAGDARIQNTTINLGAFETVINGPTLSTTAASGIAFTSATLAGDVTGNGGASVTERGVVYALTSVNNDPEIDDIDAIKVVMGSGTGAFDQLVTGLASGTSYTVKAFATSAFGTSYGAVQTFETLPAPGGVASEIAIWIKPDLGPLNSSNAATDNQTVTTWTDQANPGGDTFTSTGYTAPTFKDNATDNINFNSVVDFSGNVGMKYTAPVFSSGTGAEDGMTWFAIVKPNDAPSSATDQMVFDIGNFAGNGYGFVYGDENLFGYSATNHGGNSDGRTLTHTNATATTLARFTVDFGATQSINLNGSANAKSNLPITLTKLTASEIFYNANSGSNRGPFTLGRLSQANFFNTNRSYNGKLAELIGYRRVLTAAEVNQIESYLALKYGITKDNAGGGTAGDYVASDNTSLWDADQGVDYHQQVIGIGRDDAQQLMQKQSQTSDKSVVLYTGTLAATNSANPASFTNDKGLVLIGNNSGAMLTTTTEIVANGAASRLEREWKVTKTNFADAISMDFTLDAGINPAEVTTSRIQLLVDTDGDFSNGGTSTFANGTNGLSITHNNGVITVSGISASHLPDNTTSYITLANVTNSAPGVNTTAASGTSFREATLGGEVTEDGGVAVTDRGVVYALTSDGATLETGQANVTQVAMGTGTGSFSQLITGLAPGTAYEFKAYAINSEGTTYGPKQSFSTTNPSITYSGPGFTETGANLGAVSGAIVATLNGAAFKDPLTTSEVTLGNVPNGLNPVFTVAQVSATQWTATLTLTGSATSNLDTDDVSDITFQFTDAAFTDATAGIVTNATGPASSSLGIDFTQNPFITYSGAGFVETPTNTGVVSGEIIATLDGDTFNDPITATELTLTNVPAGLSPSFAVNNSGGQSRLTITLTGTASSSDDTDDVADITFNFNDAAFTNSTAIIVNNATGPASSGLGVNFNFDANAPVITSNGGGATATVNVNENATAVTTVTATDADAVSTVTFSITGGADQADFNIDNNTGVLTFINAPDFEAPSDTGLDNTYEVIVSATDGTNSNTQSISITVGDVGEAPEFTSTPVTSVADNADYVYTIITSDEDGDAVSVTATTSPTWLSISRGSTVSSLSGIRSSGFADGPLATAQFNSPAGLAVDAAGNIYVADGSNQRIRKISTNGIVSTVAGGPVPGAANGTGTNAQFRYVTAIEIDANGNLFVADQTNHMIRKIDPNGVVTTVAGSGNAGFFDGVGTAAEFDNPIGLALDAAGYIYVVDAGNHTVRKIAPNGTVTTLAGDARRPGFNNGIGTNAQFDNPRGITIDAVGNLYVVDQFNNLIRKITPAGVVTTMVGNEGVRGDLDGTGTAAEFNRPFGISTDGAGNFFVTDLLNYKIRKIDPNGVVTTVAGTTRGFNDGFAATAKFNSSAGIVVDNEGNLLVGDISNHLIRKVVLDGLVLSGSASGQAGTENVVLQADDGNGTTNTQSFTITVTDATAPVFTSATTLNVAENTTGTIYTATATDTNPTATLSYSLVPVSGNDAVRFDITTAGALTFKNDPDFENPHDGNGDNNYIARIRVSDGINEAEQDVTITVTNVNEATTITSTPVTSVADNTPYEYHVSTTDVDGDPVSVATTIKPDWLTLTSTANGVVTSLAGATQGFTDGTGTNAQFDRPADIAIDAAGNLYAVDENNHSIRKVSPAGVVTTLAGRGSPSSIDGTGTAAGFSIPEGIVVDNDGNVFVAERGGRSIRKITPSGVVTRLAGSPSNFSSIDGIGTAAGFIGPERIVIDTHGNLFVTDQGTIRKVTSTGVVSTFAGQGSATIADGTGTDARFQSTGGITIDAQNNLYVIGYSGSIRKITPQRVVTTLINGSATPFDSYSDIAIDSQGNFFVTNTDEYEVFKVTQTGLVTSVAGSGIYGFADGTGTNAQFGGLYGVTLDADENLFVTDRSIEGIRKVTVGRDILSGDPSLQVGTHNVTLEASDGNGSTDTQSFTITVNDVTDPVFTSATTTSIAENTTGTVYTATATDNNPQVNLTFSLGTGNDDARFSIDPGTGALAFVSAPDFEMADDLDSGNDYEVDIKVSDGINEISQRVTITVTDANDAPVITSSPATAVNDDQNYEYQIQATDADGDEMTLSAPGLPGWLSVSTVRTVTTFAGASEGSMDGTGTAALFSDPAGMAMDENGDIYVVDGGNHRIRKIDRSGVVTTLAGSTQGYADGVGTAARFDQPAGMAYDGDGGLIIADFANNRIRRLDISTGQVTTIAGASAIGFAGGFVDGAGNVAEFNSPYGVAVDPSGNIYVADSGNHSIRKIDPSGTVSTLAGSIQGFADGTGTNAQFSAPLDVATDKVGNVFATDGFNHKIRKITSLGVVSTVAGSTQGNSDGSGTAAQFDIPWSLVVDGSGNIFVTDANNHSVRKINTTGMVTTLVGNGTVGSADGVGTAAQLHQPFGIIRNNEGDLFVSDLGNHRVRKIEQTMTLSGSAVGQAGSHNITINVADGEGGTAQSSFTLVVNDVTHPVFTSATTTSVNENHNGVAYTAVATDNGNVALTYSLGTDRNESGFNINAASGEVSFKASPDFENPLVGSSNNDYILEIIVTDGNNDARQIVTISVADINDNTPVITSDGSAASASINLNENETAVTTVSATDADAISTITYSISGGADQALFSIDSNTGALTFTSAPDFESPTDNDANNTYIVEVTASDGTNNDTQTITVNLQNLNDSSPVITSDGGGATASISVNENSTAVTTVMATDADALGALSYTITGGADQTAFSLVSSTGVLSLNSVPDFETPADADGNNSYIVEVTVSDGTNNDVQIITVNVQDLEDNTPVITSDGGSATASININENQTAITTVSATDADAISTVTYSLSGGADQALFSIDSNTGVLTFTSAPDFESPTDSDANNTYIVEFTASDGTNSDTQTITITIQNLNDSSPVISSDGGGASTSIIVNENSTGVTVITATDADALGALSYSITGGADQSAFSLVSSTGVLSFNSAPDFETPTDADVNNSYIVEVTVSDGTNADVQTITVNVQDLEDNTPVITSDGGAATASINVNENETAVTTITATDADAISTVTYNLSGGADQALFSIDNNTGVLALISAPDFESPTDNDVNNSYLVEVTATDGTNTDVQTITVNVQDREDNLPVITSDGGLITASLNINENETAVTTITATDADAISTITYSLSGGADQALFSIDSNTGALTFTSAPDFESPTDSDVNNTYIVEVTASDGTNSDTQIITVNLQNLNDSSPVITSDGGGASTSISVNENSTAVTNFAATDADALGALSYTITGGADQTAFSLVSSTGVLTLNAAPDFETPADADGNNSYIVEVTVSDGTNTDLQTITVNVQDLEDNTPVITSDGGAATASININENETAITTVSATDADAISTVTYSLSGGADKALFSIDSNTGVLTFTSAPDFESPTDSDANNTYIVEVTVSDGANSDTQTITISIQNLNDSSPVITSDGGGASASISVNENSNAVTTVIATDVDALGALSYTITGGADQAAFSLLSSTGVLSFNSAPDFESPTDADGNNNYVVEVTVSDGTNTDVQTITVNIQDLEDNTPVITSDGGAATASLNINENETAVTTVTATDADAISTVTYNLSGGADQALFSIDNSTGALTFISAPDFESPTDSDANNSYLVEVTATDGTNNDVQTITLNVQDIDDNAPVITSDGGAATASINVNENETVVTTVSATDADAISTVTYSISGGADQALFSIDSNTGDLTFNSVPDFESPTDNDANNTYIVEVTASDGTNNDTQTITVNLQNLNDSSPVITSDGGGASASISVNENSTAVTTVAATDADALGALSYTITGGADQTAFSLASTTGVLSLNAGPDFETPADADGNNSYIVEVTVSDGTNTDLQTITVNVQDLEDNTPVIISDGGSATASININENETAVTTITATDADVISTVTYSLSGGADQGLFSIDSNTGALTFTIAPDFESPTDSDANNTYIVEVTASDGTNKDTQTIKVNLQNLNDSSPVITSDGGGASTSISVNENSTSVTTVTATDVDALGAISYTITGGADQTAFSLVSSTGVLSFNLAPDFETPTDADGNNSYIVEVTVSDGTNTDLQTITLNIQDLEDNTPVITSDGGSATASLNINENETAVTTITATDADAISMVTYSISGGADQALFGIDINTGVLAFTSAPDFESPTDADANNSYIVEVTASDGMNSDVQTITITVLDLDEIAPSATLSSAASSLVNGAFELNILYTEQVTGFDLSDLIVTNGAASDLTLVSPGLSWKVNINPTADGPVSIDLPANAAVDSAGNGNQAATTFSIVNDQTAPTILLSASLVSQGIYRVTAQFSEAINGFNLADVSINQGQGINFVVVDADTYTFEVTSNNASAQVSIQANVATDLAGNGNSTSNEINLVFNSIPTDISLSNTAIDENNEPGVVIGELTTTDADVSDSHVYALASGAGDTDNASFIIDGTSLKAAVAFDFETQSGYNIRLSTDDGQGGVFEKAFSITIINVGEPIIEVVGEVDFDETPLGITRSTPITLTNTGDATTEVIVTSGPADFSVTPGSVILTAGQSAQLSVNFTPTQAITYQGEIVFTYAGREVPWSVKGIGAIITGVDDPVLHPSEIKIHPIPASEVLNIDLTESHAPKLDIEVINAQGIPVFALKGYTKKQLSIRVSDYQSGIYIIQFTDGLSVIKKKVIIRK
ncbi:MAG: hypothetical protein Roseis2KO_31970 [Roseivirga sp.]